MDGFHGYRRARLHPLLDDTNLAESTIVCGSGLHVERVRRTLLDGNDLPHVIALESDTLGSDEVTAPDVHFDDMALNSWQILCITRPLEITSNTIGKGEAVPGVNGVTLFSSCSNRILYDVWNGRGTLSTRFVLLQSAKHSSVLEVSHAPRPLSHRRHRAHQRGVRPNVRHRRPAALLLLGDRPHAA
ncbi:MAG: hypothetical protein JNK25_06090 [Phycisphaerae bacterium]|nr:hypothetical protein [Phycisphaerae bacterium]